MVHRSGYTIPKPAALAPSSLLPRPPPYPLSTAQQRPPSPRTLAPPPRRATTSPTSPSSAATSSPPARPTPSSSSPPAAPLPLPLQHSTSKEPILSVLLGVAVAFVFLAGYLRSKRADITHVPPSVVAAAPDLPKQVRPATQNKKGRPQHHHASAADKVHPHLARGGQEAAKKHHHLDLNTLKGHTDCVTTLDFSSDACNLTTGH
ncbi:hypothetical protein ZWY2020_037112 [Hordeum vulgare]|nr:hypothetical protein ZWY2020_037112 [Hordeum vulgare]